MKNLHLLYTDKLSRLFYLGSNLHLEQGQLIAPKNYQHIYITSDEEIKEGDWCLDIKRNIIFQSKRNEIGTSKKIPIIICTYEGCYIQKDCKKIILTTNADLIDEGIQAIDDEFLEWFVKNPSCEEVEVEIETTSIQLPQQQLSENSYDLAFRWINKKVYKIIIPKEEPKQETLEEAAERYLESKNWRNIGSFNQLQNIFTEGAKWQAERMCSEEEVVQLLIKFNQEIQEVEDVRGWFEQFKKK